MHRGGGILRELNASSLLMASPPEALPVMAASDAADLEFEPEELAQAPLSIAVEREDTEMLQRILKLGVSPNHIEHGQPILFSALARQNIQCARALLDAGADTSVVNSLGGTALHQAICFGNARDEALNLLTNPPHNLKFPHPFMEAAYYGRLSELQELPVEVLQTEDGLGLNTMHYAALGGQVEALKFLIEKLPAGSVSQKSRFRGRTPLHLATMRDRVEAIDFLLQNGASVNEVDARGDNILILASRLARRKSLQHILTTMSLPIDAISEDMGDTALSIGTIQRV